MERIDKTKGLNLKKADPAADIGLINQYSAKELKPEEVFCFSLILCDNDVDRDTERFTNASLDAMAPLFLGKTGLSDHRWTVERQIARLYRVSVEDTGKMNSLNEPLRVLRGSAYMLNSEANKPLIEVIEGGIVKEVSVGCEIGKCVCSICGEALRFSWRAWKDQCENGHIKGDKYDGKLCYGNLEDPTDAFEFSFVAVPAQRGAGVTKTAENVSEAFKLLLVADLSGQTENVKALMLHLQNALTDEKEREERAKIQAENDEYRTKYIQK